MFTITKQYRTETGHRLVNYDGKCAHLHGHSYLFEVTVTNLTGSGLLDERGMVLDFKDLKAAMKELLEPWDHALLLHEGDVLAKHFRAFAESPEGVPLLDATNGERPRVLVYTWNPTAENMAAFIALKLGARGFDVQRVRVQETDTSFAEWTPPVSQGAG